jgi:hypothetical protein
MANYCSTCGTPLPIDSSAEHCWQHGGPPLTSDSLIRCPFCKEIIFAQATKCRFCGEFLSKPTSVAVGPPSPTRRYPIGSMYCTSCGNVGAPRGMNRFELVFVLIVSIFTLFIPLMIYLFVRSGNRCRRCGKKTLIPLDSPGARMALERVNSSAEIQKASPPQQYRGANPQLKQSVGWMSSVADWIGTHPFWSILITLFVIGTMGARLVDISDSTATREQQGQSQPTPDQVQGHSFDAAADIACEDYVKGQLKAPATAEFQSIFGRTIADEGNGRYGVSSYVDSQNDFGADVRTDFTCQVQCSGENSCAVVDFSSSP